MPFNSTTAASLAQFVQFAYGMYQTSQANGNTLTPPVDPRLEAAGYNLTYWLAAQDFTDTLFYGYMAQSIANPGDIVLAIRGTETPEEWILDFEALPVFFHAGAEAGFVALGFNDVQQSFQFLDGAGTISSLADAIVRISATATITSVKILGHSLGGALAVLSAAELAIRNTAGVKPLIELYTYAAPTVGLPDFADWCNNNIGTIWRVWNVLDIVPYVPPVPYLHEAGLGYPLVQNVGQLESINTIPRCEHNLGTYQWLLDAQDFPLNNGCLVVEPRELIRTAEAVPSRRQVGAQALHDAMLALSTPAPPAAQPTGQPTSPPNQ